MAAKPSRVVGVVFLALTGAVAAGCGGSSNSGSVAAPVAATSAKSPAETTVRAESGTLGTILTDAAGRTLYLFAADTGSSSTCNGACAKFWPPLLAKGSVAAANGAVASKLGTTHRADGSTQVTYAGHPLYYFAKDVHAGDANGQALNASGGLWWVVSPAGTAITTKPGATASSAAYQGY